VHLPDFPCRHETEHGAREFSLNMAARRQQAAVGVAALVGASPASCSLYQHVRTA
jgi:hypothetical protein